LGKPNQTEAVRLYRLAAQQGDAEACFQLSVLYRDGIEVPQDSVASAGWCRLAAERGLGVAQNEYGIMLVSGVGLTRNPAEAAQWFQRAAQQQIPAAFFNLAALHENGVGIPGNPTEALRLYETAAKGNHTGAQLRLAILLNSGAITGAADPVGAAYWAERSARNDSNASELSKQLRSALSSDQLGELQRRLQAAGLELSGR
jgi:TPR repeat protein